MKKIGIIGANGLLGSELINRFNTHFSTTAITKENYAKHIGSSFDVLINANGNSKRFWANAHLIEDFNLSTVSVYRSLTDFAYKKYIYISSNDVYEFHSNPKYAKEQQAIDPRNLSIYGFHKFLSEQIVTKHAKDYLILRSSMILGKNLKKGPIFDILHGNGLYISSESRLQMITANEISNIIYFLIKKKSTNQIYNMGGSGIVYFKKINKFFSDPITFLAAGEKQAYHMDISKLHKIFPLKTSEEYLREFINTKQSKNT